MAAIETVLIIRNANVPRVAVRSSAWLGERRAVLPSVEWRGQTPLCEHNAKAQARLAAELLRFDEVLDQYASIRFDDAL